MEIQWQNLETRAKHGRYKQTVCTPQCKIFKSYARYNDLIYTIASLDDLDLGVQEAIIEKLSPSEDICQIVVSPRQQNDAALSKDQIGQGTQTVQPCSYDWVMVLTRDNLILFNAVSPDRSPQVRKVSFENLLSISRKRILLQSWVDWSWVDGQKVVHTRINFNSSGEKIIEETLGYIFETNLSCDKKSPEALRAQILKKDALPSKIVDHLSMLLNPQENILAMAHYPFQAAVWKSWHGLFRKQERKATPTSAFILTDKQFILICEDDKEKGLSLGTFIQAIKRKNILGYRIEETQDGTRFALRVGDKTTEERIIFCVPEEYFEDLIEKFQF